jgi:hypothetical protein
MSHFKKSKGLTNRSPSPNPSTILTGSKTKGNFISNESGNYMSELQKASMKNDNLMASLLKDGLFEDPEPQSILLSNKNVDISDITSGGQKTPSVQAKPAPDNPFVRAKSPSGKKKPAKKKAGIMDFNEPDEQQDTPALQTRKSEPPKPKVPNFENTSFGKSAKPLPVDPTIGELKNHIAQEQRREEGTEVVEPGYYKNNVEQVLMVLSLKKIIRQLQEENSTLKESKYQLEVKDSDNTLRIQKLERTLNEYEIKERLWNKNHSEYIKFDLEDLDQKLKDVDFSLTEATANNVQEKFLEDIVLKNREHVERSEANGETLRQLKDNIGRLKNTLGTLNKM